MSGLPRRGDERGDPPDPRKAGVPGLAPPPREFAVLVPFLDHAGERCILLTKRPQGQGPYAGQVSLPGGAREAKDASLLETALREAEEEVGIPRGHVEVRRELDWHETRLGHRVKPFVAEVRTPCPLRLEPREVEKVLYLPARRLEPALFALRGTWRDAAGRERPIYTFDLDGCEVWGLTARILRDLLPGGAAT